MRIVSWPWLAVTAAICVADVTSRAHADDEADANAARAALIKKVVKASDLRIDGGAAKLAVIPAVGVYKGCGKFKGYNAADVARIRELAKNELRDQLLAEGFDGLASHVEEYFPVAPSGKRNPCVDSEIMIVSRDDILTFVAAAKSVLGDIELRGKTWHSVAIVSEPPKATFVVRAKHGTKAHTNTSNATITGIDRGPYVFTVTRKGYKRCDGFFNSINHSVGSLHAELAKEGSDDVSTCKWLTAEGEK